MPAFGAETSSEPEVTESPADEPAPEPEPEPSESAEEIQPASEPESAEESNSANETGTAEEEVEVNANESPATAASSRATSSETTDAAGEEGTVAPSVPASEVRGTSTSAADGQTGVVENDESSPSGLNEDSTEFEKSTTTEEAPANTHTASGDSPDSENSPDASNEEMIEESSTSSTTSNSETSSTTRSISEVKASTTPETVASSSVQTVFTKPDTESCYDLSDGMKFCEERDLFPNIDTTEQIDWTVKAIPDEDGDLEIYFYDGSDIIKITDNRLTDSAPHFDAESNSIVWQQLLNERYQIFEYTFSDGQIRQLTNTSVNNMEPSRYGTYTVWQRWFDSSWEIMLLQNEFEKRLTNNNFHDLLPDVQNGFVVWNSHQKSEPSVMVYQIKSETITSIDDTDGGQVANPRYVLIYDKQFSNGDSVTRGFDPETGRLIHLAAQSEDRQNEIPESDQTGETRALIQNKSQRENFEEEVVPKTPSGSTTSSAETNASSTETTSDLTLTVSTQEAETLPLTDYDIIVEPLARATSTER